jgi:hypothetical protein
MSGELAFHLFARSCEARARILLPFCHSQRIDHIIELPAGSRRIQSKTGCAKCESFDRVARNFKLSVDGSMSVDWYSWALTYFENIVSTDSYVRVDLIAFAPIEAALEALFVKRGFGRFAYLGSIPLECTPALLDKQRRYLPVDLNISADSYDTLAHGELLIRVKEALKIIDSAEDAARVEHMIQTVQGLREAMEAVAQPRKN